MCDLRQRESDSELVKGKNVMRKILLFMVCCTLVCGLNGCTFFGSGSSNEFRSDEELADEMIEKIIACVEKEDEEGLK